jgi:hypothetical protein
MGPRRKLHFAALDDAVDYLNTDPRRKWERCPACAVAVSPTTLREVSVSPGEYMPFAPKAAAQLALRQALRERIASLVIPADHVVAAT